MTAPAWAGLRIPDAWFHRWGSARFSDVAARLMVKAEMDTGRVHIWKLDERRRVWRLEEMET